MSEPRPDDYDQPGTPEQQALADAVAQTFGRNLNKYDRANDILAALAERGYVVSNHPCHVERCDVLDIHEAEEAEAAQLQAGRKEPETRG